MFCVQVILSFLMSERLRGWLLLVDRVRGLDDELLGEDVGELGAVAFPAACDLQVCVVVVGGGQEVAEHQLADVALSLLVVWGGLRALEALRAPPLVDLGWDALPVVPDTDHVLLRVDVDLDLVHRGA